MSTAEAIAKAVPSHVPAELVRDYPFAGYGRLTTLDPRSLLPALHAGPAMIWATDVHPQGNGAWVPRRHADLQQIYMDVARFSPRGMAPFSALTGEDWFLLPVEADPPLHTRYRLAMNPMFAPAKISRLDARMRDYARDEMTALRRRGGCEFVADFAFRFPIVVFLELMGLPVENMMQFLRWEQSILRASGTDEIAAATRQITAYLREECDKRRSFPKDDLLTLGVQAQVEGRGLTDAELTGFCFNLFVGGLDTVSTNMSSHFRFLAENPDQQRWLRENPHRIPDAIEELMRAYAAVTTSRRCVLETQVAGVTVMPGDFIMLPTILAGNDPEAFAHPDIIDFDRKARHVSFGYGPHTCIGVHLARRELRIAMEAALAILPPFRIAPDTEITSYLGSIVGPRELPLVWN